MTQLVACHLFQLKLNYDQVELGASGTAQYNGNIAQLTWRVRGRERQTYGFDYDFLNRLDLANYYDITDGGTPRKKGPDASMVEPVLTEQMSAVCYSAACRPA